MSPSVRVVAALLALLTIFGGSAVVVAQPGGPASGSMEDVSTAETLNASTTIWIELGEGGDAHWNVSMVATLPDQAAVDSFRDLATSFRANESDVLPTATFRRYVRLADNSTSRDMQLTDVERNATLGNGTGRLELSFTWEKFGRRDGSTVHVAAAFTGPDGLWLKGLTADQQLVVAVPESFDITSAPKGYTNRTIRWDGPTTFQPADFEITYDVNPTPPDTPTRTAGPTTPTATPTPTTPTTEPTTSTETTVTGPSQGGGISPVAIIVALVAVIAGGVYLSRHGDLLPSSSAADDDGATARTDGDDQPDGSPPGDSGTTAESGEDTATESGGDTATESGGDAATESGGDTATESGGDAATEAGGDAATEAGGDVDSETSGAEDDQPPLDGELLSDEEYVEALIDRNGGRMKQANIVTETGWSNAKVSQLLSAMAEAGRVEKLRIGRENLISLPDDDGDGD